MGTTVDNIRPIDSIGEVCRNRCMLLVNNIKKSRKTEEFKKIDTKPNNIKQEKYFLKEINSIQLIRSRTFSHWPHSKPSGEMMSSNGWFSCNVSDRVICIYCNQICHGWTKDDDPYQVHRDFSPQCPFILSKSLLNSSPLIVNDTYEAAPSPCHPTMIELPSRCLTFTDNWTQTSPSIDELARSGFFYSGINNAVTCFFCGGSLQNWGINDNPVIEHVRWFPHCQYAKHLCGEKLYNKIEISKKAKESQKNKIDEVNLSRLVASRLDLPVVQRFLSFYKLSIIKRCIEDQLRIKQNDFTSDGDFFIACLILQKQIYIIQGDKNKLIVPSQNRKIIIEKPIESISKNENMNCLVCLCEDKQLACIPCGHLCACVPCAHSLRSCLICRHQIQSFVRIYS